MSVGADIPQDRHLRYLKLAAEAEINSYKTKDATLKAGWVDMAVAWMMLASDFAQEPVRARRRHAFKEDRAAIR
jgi:hypothetical protein